MIKTHEILDKTMSVIFNNLLTTDPDIYCQIETIKNLESMILFYRDNWNIEYMPTSLNEVDDCARYYDVDQYAVKGLKKIAEGIHFFLTSN